MKEMGVFRKWMIGGMIMGVMMGVITGCGEEERKPTTVEEKPLVTLHIGTPAGDEVEYTRATQEESEKEINTLTVYDFEVKTLEDGTTKRTVIDRQVLQRTSGTGIPRPGCFINTEGGATARLSIYAEEGSTHVFACVANEEETRFDAIAQMGVTPIDSLLQTTSSRKLKDGDNAGRLTDAGMVMSGKSGEVVITNGGTFAVELQRIVARVDVKNNMPAGNSLQLVEVSAENCTTAGYLFEQEDDGTLNRTRYDYTGLATVTQNPAVATELGSLATGATCGKVLYLYEHSVTDSKGQETPTPILILRYTISGVPDERRIPMVTSTEVGTQRFDIGRNRVYTLIVGDGSSVKSVACTVTEGKKDGTE